MARPLLVVSGTYRQPELRAFFSRNAPHPRVPGKGLIDLMKSFDSAYFRKDRNRGDHWFISGLGRFDADRVFDRAGFDIDFESETYDTDLEGVDTLDELVDPIMQLASDRRMVLVRPRLLGFKKSKELLGSGAMWDKGRQRFYMPVGDLIKRGEPRPDLDIPEDALEAAWEQHERVHTDDDLLSQASKAALAKDVTDLTAEEIKALTDQVGDIPEWFGLDLYPYQRVGALAVAAGHNLLADSMRVGKTRTGLAVAAMRNSRRTLIVSPPVVLTNWQRNVDDCFLATLGGKQPEGKTIEFRPGRKEPDLPDSGVVIISDSLMSSRQHIQDAIVNWAPDVLIFDEAHRAKNFESARTRAVLRVAAASDFAVPMTGTPLFQTPQELAPLLEMTGHLTPVFGGLDEFMEAYCVQNKWGGWAPRMKSLPELRKMLDTYVWVRRTKDQVLKDLPKVSRGDLDIDIDLKLFNAAHREVSEKVSEWIEDFYEDFGRLPSHEHTNGKGKVVDEIAEFAREHGIEFISKLRRAAGLAKVPTAVEYIKEHVYSTTEVVNGRKVFTRPLLVWTYHTEVSEEMSEVVPNEVDDAAIIMGGISQNKRQRLIDEFQEGKIPVLVCQISAAGVGIDLTRSSDAIFVETDWVNALVQQAEERVQGVNQKRPVMLTTMVARGTLDDRIQRVLHEKSKILDPLLGGKNDVSVVEVDDEAASASAVLIEIIDNELRKYKKGRR